MSQTNGLPLDGIRVIDFTQVMLGPCATQMLADFGADVIKVERPGVGDLSRSSFGGGDEKALNNPVFCSLNRNKRSIELDTKSPEAKQVIYDLVSTADVVVSNFRPGVMEKMGFGYQALKNINPGIIFASGSGFGVRGPNLHKGGQDVLAQAMSGVMERRSGDDIPRSINPTALCDYSAGMHLVQGVLAALFARERSGRGQEVSVSLYDSMIAMQMQEAAMWLAEEVDLNWAAMPLSGVFETSDGAVVLVGAFKQNPLQDICNALGLEDLSVAYPDLHRQREAKDLLHRHFRTAFAGLTTEGALERLEAQDLLCGPVRSLDQALEDEQTKVNEMVATHNHPLHGPMQLVASPVHMSEAPFGIRGAPPRLGEHTDEVLAELDRLRQSADNTDAA